MELVRFCIPNVGYKMAVVRANLASSQGPHSLRRGTLGEGPGTRLVLTVSLHKIFTDFKQSTLVCAARLEIGEIVLFFH